MGLRLIVIIFALGFGALGVWGLTSSSDDAVRRFEAHEFAVFRSEYESLRVQSASRRIEHFRGLLDAVENSKVTPGMAETLSEFCHGVANSGEEVPTVQAEAKVVLRALEAKSASRSPASVPATK